MQADSLTPWPTCQILCKFLNRDLGSDQNESLLSHAASVFGRGVEEVARYGHPPFLICLCRQRQDLSPQIPVLGKLGNSLPGLPHRTWSLCIPWQLPNVSLLFMRAWTGASTTFKAAASTAPDAGS